MSTNYNFSEEAETMHAGAEQEEMWQEAQIWQDEIPAPDDEPHGWPGDGSGEDDLADYNQNEAETIRTSET